MNTFKVIGEYPNYEINEKGEIRNRKHLNILKNQFVARRDGCIISRIGLYNVNGKLCCAKLHRLLAQAFIPNPQNKPQIDHKDKNTLNNKLSNLRWATNSENSLNRKVRCDNRLGIKNVTFRTDRNRYYFKKQVNNVVVGSSTHGDLPSAIYARNMWYANNYNEFNSY